ncbi:MAG: glycerol-3-phosphate 1-O-acyltransferase PlsY [Actinomycetes bacterium]
MKLLLAVVASYVIGSIDFAVIVAQMKGVDIHSVGSGNPGTSNVLRTLGKGPAAAVLIGDAIKGVIGAYLGVLASQNPAAVGGLVVTDHWAYLAGLFAVVGHCYPIFHKFRGGRGVATSLGVLLYTIPLIGLGALALWLIIVKLTKVAAVASLITVAVTLPVAWAVGVRGLAFLWVCLMVALIVFRHRENVARLIKGSEQKVPT